MVKVKCLMSHLIALALMACHSPPVLDDAEANALNGMPDTVEAARSDILPQFERTAPSRGHLSYSWDGRKVVATLVAAGQPNGAATPADCAVQISGVLAPDDRVRGHVVPYGDVAAVDMGPAPLKVDLQIGAEGVMVIDHGAASRLCGMGSQIEGFYRRMDTPAR